jgi:hypothetical protein
MLSTPEISRAARAGAHSKSPLRLALLLLVIAASVIVASRTLPAQTEPKRASVLFPFYQQYLAASEAHDLDKLLALSSDESTKLIFEKMKQLKDEKQKNEIFHMIVQEQPESPAIVNEKIVGDRGLLAVQGYSRGDLIEMNPDNVPKGFRVAHYKPFKKRQYELALFKRINGEWKLYRIKSFTYIDPRPTLEAIEGSHQLNTEGVQFHCNFSQEDVIPGDRQSQWMHESAHWSCFAKLRRDASLCDRIGNLVPQAQKAFFADQTQMQQTQCKLEVVDLIGDPKICQSIQNSKILPNAQQQCLNSIEDYDFIPGLNIYTLDSDGDGLSDLQEIEFFNTSANNPDTDGDGKTDFEKVEAMTNPLGPGKLGDHLK